MGLRPSIFVSAVSQELRSSRQLVANTLHFLGYEPVWQDTFGTEQGDLREMLRRKVDESDGVVQLVGHRYGAEPPTVDPTYGRISYTQYEAIYARSKGKKVWYLLLTDDFPTDAAPPESQELRDLQAAYRTGFEGRDLYHSINTTQAIEASVLKLKNELALLRAKARRWAMALAGVLLLIVAITAWIAWRQTRPVIASTVGDQWVAQQSDQTYAALAALTPEALSPTLSFSALSLAGNVDVTPKSGPLVDAAMPALMQNAVCFIAIDDGPFERMVFAPKLLIKGKHLPDKGVLKFKFVTIPETTHAPERTFGPIVCPVDFRAQLLTAYKKMIAGETDIVPAMGHWVKPIGAGSGRWQFAELQHYYPAIASAHVGTSADKLSTIVPINTDGHVTLPEDHKRLTYMLKPIRGIESGSVFVQFEYVDGTRSEVRKFVNSDAGERFAAARPRSRFAGRADFVPLKVSGEVNTATALLGAYEFYSDDGKLTIMLEYPQNAMPTSVRYGFDEAPETPARLQFNFVEIQEWTTAKELRVSSKTADGQQVGDTVQLADPSDVVVKKSKQQLNAALPTALSCVAMPTGYGPPRDPHIPLRGPYTTEQQAALDDFTRQTAAFRAVGLQMEAKYGLDGYRQDGGAALCTPGNVRVDPPSFWVGVREVQVGTRAGALDQTVPVNIDWKHFLATGKVLVPETEVNQVRDDRLQRDVNRSWILWFTRFPLGTKKVYARFKFQDGTMSDEVRYNVAPFPAAEN